MVYLSILNISTSSRPLKIGIELDSIRRVNVNTLHLAAQPLSLGQRGHHLQRIAQNHAVAPVGVVLVELGFGVLTRQPVKIIEQVKLLELAFFFLHFRLAAQVVDQYLGVNLFLDVHRRHLNNQV